MENYFVCCQWHGIDVHKPAAQPLPIRSRISASSIPRVNGRIKNIDKSRCSPSFSPLAQTYCSDNRIRTLSLVFPPNCVKIKRQKQYASHALSPSLVYFSLCLTSPWRKHSTSQSKVNCIIIGVYPMAAILIHFIEWMNEWILLNRA